MAAKLRVTLRRSVVGTNPKARGTVRALGLRKIGQTVEPESPRTSNLDPVAFELESAT